MWRSRSASSVNAATPLVVGDIIFISATYETGAAALRVQGSELKELWASDEALSNHYATSVYFNGYLYGFHGRQEYNPSFRAVELTTGAVKWSVDRFHAGTVTLAGDKLLILKETGEMILANATPQAFQPLAQAQILPPTIRATPAVSDGFLYIRNTDTPDAILGLFRSAIRREIGCLGAMRKIDIFTHIYPGAFYDKLMRVAGDFKDVGKRSRGVPMLYDLDERFRVMDRFQDYQQILSLPTPPLEVMGNPAEAADLARLANDGMAELVAQYPDRFAGFVASLPFNDPDGSVREARRAMDDLGARGIQIFSNIQGKPISAPEFLPIFETMASYDLPLWLHPYRGAAWSDYPTEETSQFEVWWTFGWPYDTSVAMARIVFAGLFDRFPGLKIISHHMGAMVPYFEGRVGHGWDQLGARTSDQDLSLVLKRLEKRPIDYFRMFYADTALMGAFDGTVCGLGFFGVDHVLFASDAPFDPEKGPMYIRETLAIIDRLPISADERERIYWRNAAALLKL